MSGTRRSTTSGQVEGMGSVGSRTRVRRPANLRRSGASRFITEVEAAIGPRESRRAKRGRRPHRGGQIDRGKQQQGGWHYRRDHQAAQQDGKTDATPYRGPNVREKIVPSTDDVVRTNHDGQHPDDSHPTVLGWREAERAENEARHEE